MRKRLALLSVLTLSIALAAAASALISGSPFDALREGVAALGPVAGWRCAETSTYAYDPRHERGDDSLLDDAPEAAVRAADPRVDVSRVEVDLHSGQAVAWTELPSGAQRVFVLAPGRIHTIGVDRDGVWLPICDSHLGDWHIIGEHALG